LAEVIDIGHGFKINIPDNMYHYKVESSDRMTGFIEFYELTQEEINDYKILAARAGYDGNEVLTEITSKEDFEWWEREKDDFGREENFGYLGEIIDEHCNKKKIGEDNVKRRLMRCIAENLKIRNNATVSFRIGMGNLESPELKRLNGLSDSELSSLGKKEIKSIRKEHASKIKFKSKSKKWIEKGVRHIKITNEAQFYVLARSQITSSLSGSKTILTTMVIPYKNRRLSISAYCFKKYCKDIEKKMAKIIEPTISLNTENVKAYNYYKVNEMIKLVKTVKKGYRIYRVAKLLIFLI
jgi:hypothetical protein